MPLPGGSSDKFGNLYELWWTVLQFLRMLHGKVESIRIETPGVEKAEFVLISSGRKEFHQAKRSNPDGKWSLSSLASSNVELLQTIFAELSGNDARFVFVSGSDAPELKELAHQYLGEILGTALACIGRERFHLPLARRIPGHAIGVPTKAGFINLGQDLLSVLDTLWPLSHILVAIFDGILCREQQNYHFPLKKWCALQGLNLRPLPCEGSALPLS